MKKLPIILGLIILILIIVFIAIKKPSQISQNLQNVGTEVKKEGEKVEQEKTKEENSKQMTIKIETPEPGATSVPENVAVPSNVVPSVSGESAFRNFDISIENKKLKPSIIVVNKMDVVTLNITAVDNDYSFEIPSYGISVPINKGQKRQIQFQATAEGQYDILCKNCKDGIGGTFVVNLKK
jgi:heme/copper-type cytochrome/quinol oxidase subunit 2